MKKFSLAIIMAISLSILLTGCNKVTTDTDQGLNNEINTETQQDWDTKANETTNELDKILDKETKQEDNNENKNKNKEETNSNRIYENKTNNFSFEFSDWREFQEDKYWFTVVVFTPKDDEIKENVGIAVQQLQKFISIQEYYEETVNKLTETLNWFKEINNYEVSNKNTDTLKWKTIVYEYNEWDLTLKSQQTFFMWTENTVYILNYTATADTFDKFIDWANTIINSFSLE